MNTVSNRLESKNYVATDHDVELLAAAHLACSEATKRADGSYLRILIAALQAQFNGKRSHKKPTKTDLLHHGDFLAKTHTRLYQFVLKGVTTPDVEDNEELDADIRRSRAAVRASRGSFARSAASTIQMYIRSGGDVRTLDVTTVSKTSLRSWALATKPQPGPIDAMLAHLRKIEAQAADLMREDPDQARVAVTDCMERLQHILDELTGSQRDVGTESGVFQVHRGRQYRPRSQPQAA